jgi:TonB-linked SusC/RagA family outer membrane protein
MNHSVHYIQKFCKSGTRLWGALCFLLASQLVVAQDKKDTADVVVVEKRFTQISGIISSATTQKPVAGARIYYKNLTSSITDEEGKFKLSVPDNDVTVSIECPGYESKEIPVARRSEINIVLQDYTGEENTYFLPQGVFSGNSVSGAVSNLSVTDGWTKVTETPDSYWQGRIAGLNSIRHSGTSNIGSFFTLRGYNSLLATNRPLIVVDNVIYDSGIYGSSLNNNFFENPLSFLDIRDISNITVIKDASAAALYGTKAANGVIMITTSRVKELGTKIDFATFGGINMAPRSLPVMNAGSYRSYLSELLTSAGYSNSTISGLPYMNDSPDSPDYFTYHNNTDWQKKVVKTQPLSNIYLRVTGGDNIAKYALSVNYLNNNNGVDGSSLQKYNTRFNADMNLSQKLKAYTNLSFAYNESSTKDFGFAPKTNPLYLALVKAPFLTDYKVSSSGVASPDYADQDIFDIGNPSVASNNTIGGNKGYRFFGIVNFNYLLNNAITIGSNVAVTFDKIKENRFVPNYGLVSDTLKNTLANNQLGSQTKRLLNISNDTYVSYKQTFLNRHDISARAGFRFIGSRTEQDQVLAYNSATDQLISVGNGSVLYNNIEGGIGHSNWMNTYFNIDYAYSSKYFLSLNLGMDASSRFGKQILSNESGKIGGYTYAIMPSVSAAWLLSSETFLANSFFDLLKLRASVGRVGNDDIGNYAAQQYYTGQNLLGLQGVIRGNIGNPGLKWETVTKMNAGIDIAVLKERVGLSVDVFSHRTNDMLIAETIPSVAGLGYMLTNSGTMSTRGIEATLNVKAINTADLKWYVDVNFSKSITKVDQLPNNNATIYTSFGGAMLATGVGESPNIFFGNVAKGVYATDEDAAADGFYARQTDGSLRAFKGGDVRFDDQNGDKIIDDKDRTLIGNPNPDFYGGISNRVIYKNWTLDALCTFMYGNDVYNYTRRVMESGSSFNNQSTAMLNRWRGPGQVTDIPKVTYGDPMQNSRFSSRWIEDGSYFRLRTVSLSYNFPLNKDILKYVTLYGAANNVFTITKYLGYDPEFSATNSVLGQGVDNTLEPIQRSFQIGIKLGL